MSGQMRCREMLMLLRASIWDATMAALCLPAPPSRADADAWQRYGDWFRLHMPSPASMPTCHVRFIYHPDYVALQLSRSLADAVRLITILAVTVGGALDGSATSRDVPRRRRAGFRARGFVLASLFGMRFRDAASLLISDYFDSF